MPNNDALLWLSDSRSRLLLEKQHERNNRESESNNHGYKFR
jgi:hypothetical protein